MPSLGHITRCRGEVREVLLLLLYAHSAVLSRLKPIEDFTLKFRKSRILSQGRVYLYPNFDGGGIELPGNQIPCTADDLYRLLCRYRIPP